MNRPSSPSPSDPAVRKSAPQYRLRQARCPGDVRAAQLLRFMVFNLELQEGLEESYHTCLDADRFDEVCDHLLVEEASTGEIVGTYRLQTGARAASSHGYYSEQEFDFTPYEPLRPHLLELGRACVRADHRSLAVINLLWRGIAEYAVAHGVHYLIGCSSLTSEDPGVGAAAYQILQPRLVEARFRTDPVPAYRCPLDHAAAEPPRIPRLLAAYLALGAGICGPPALDRGFKTIDFLTLLDLRKVSQRWGNFLPRGAGA